MICGSSVRRRFVCLRAHSEHCGRAGGVKCDLSNAAEHLHYFPALTSSLSPRPSLESTDQYPTRESRSFEPFQGHRTRGMGWRIREMGRRTRKMGWRTLEKSCGSREMGRRTRKMGWRTREKGWRTREMGWRTREIG